MSDYKRHRIEVYAQQAGGAWNAEVRIRRTLFDEKPHVEVVTCRKPTAKAAEERAAVYARRWDRHLECRRARKRRSATSPMNE